MSLPSVSAQPLPNPPQPRCSAGQLPSSHQAPVLGEACPRAAMFPRDKGQWVVA